MTIRFLFTVISLLLSGCTYSVHPLLTNDDLVDDLDVSGKWQVEFPAGKPGKEKKNPAVILSLEKYDKSTYDVYIEDGGDKELSREKHPEWPDAWTLQIGRVEDQLYAQAIPRDMAGPPLFSGIPVYMFGRIDVRDDTIRFHAMDDISSADLAVDQELPHITYSPSEFVDLTVFTEAPEDLQGMVTKHGDLLFRGGREAVLRRVIESAPEDVSKARSSDHGSSHANQAGRPDTTPSRTTDWFRHLMKPQGKPTHKSGAGVFNSESVGKTVPSRWITIEPPESDGADLRVGLKRQDVDAIVAQTPTIATVAVERVSAVDIQSDSAESEVHVSATGPNYLRLLTDAARAQVERGRFLTDVDAEKRAKVVVLDHKLAETLFRFADPVGKSVEIGNQAFTVVGVVSHGTTSLYGELGRDVYVPLESIDPAALDSNERVSDLLDRIHVRVESLDQVKMTKTQIRNILHHLHPDASFVVR